MYNQIPYMMPSGGASTGASLLGKINWGSILSNTQKTLNVVNQVIPLYYQAKPVLSNLKTLGKIGKEFNKINTSQATENNSNNIITNLVSKNINTEDVSSNTPQPNFFL
ncbi:MAG: hypothetical protein RSA10_02490 [Bacilli bacterium]